MLVAPAASLRAAAAEPSGRGVADVAWLIGARLVAGELPRLLRAVFRGLELGVGAGLAGVVATLQEVLPDMLGVLVAGLLMSALAGRAPAPRAGETPHTGGRADALDVAAYAWVPYLTVQLVSSLWFTWRGHLPSRNVAVAVEALGGAWALAVWAFGLGALNAARRELRGGP